MFVSKLYHELYKKMEDMPAPQKWSQSALVAPWWSATVQVIKKSKYTVHVSKFGLNQH